MTETINISGRLRNRLFLILLIPMLLVSIIFTIETYIGARSIAQRSFDKSLTILTLAIMGQSENLSGDSLSENTLELINSSIGDTFFYHISALEGGFITGYSNIPKPKKPKDRELYKKLSPRKPYIFQSSYQNTPVKAAFFRQYFDDSKHKGWVDLTVWQYLDKQYEMQRVLFIHSISRLVLLILLVSLISWFGIRYGLKPLTRLQKVIAQRSVSDFSPIKTAVPFEVKSLVKAINALFSRLKIAIERREAFLGNASHQLKTPLTRIRSEAEMALRAKDNQAQEKHLQEVVHLTQYSSRLANQLLSLLRAESDELLYKKRQKLELNHLVKNVSEHYALSMVRDKREFIFEKYDDDIFVSALPIMLTEAIGNLVENAMAYSHPQENIIIKIKKNGDFAEIWVIDSGPGITIDNQDRATCRFYRVPGTRSNGCGLGLAIVEEIIKAFNGKLLFDGPRNNYFSIRIRLPLAS